MRRRKHLLRAAGAAVALLVLAGAWHLATRLSAEERAVLGRWARPEPGAGADGPVHVIEFLSNRTVRWGLFTPEGRPAPGAEVRVMRWRSRGGVVEVVWDFQTPAGLAARLRAWGRPDWIVTVRAEVADDALDLVNLNGLSLQFERTEFAPRWADPAPAPPPD